MTGINKIKAMALAYGACDTVVSLKSIADAISLLMTPQGREFALNTGFPTLEVWRKNKNEVNFTPCVYLDTKNVFASNHDIVAIGDSEVTVTLSKPDKLYHIIAMHGATVEINASNYAVVTVTSINSTVTVKNDGTAIVTVEQSEKGGKQ